MSAQIIPLPTRSKDPAAPPNDYAWMSEATRRFQLAQRIRDALAAAEPAKEEPDRLREILTLLRRLDRRLAQIPGAGALVKKKAGAQ